MAPKKKTRKKAPAGYTPRFNAHSLGQLVDLTLMMVGPEQLEQIAATAARLDESYSLTNRVAIAVQRPDATAVAGKGVWRKHGYRIGAGEKGLAIWHKRKNDKAKNTDEPTDAPANTKAEKASENDTQPSKKQRGGYGVSYVWDASQMVPIGCECADQCVCPRPEAPAPSPAGADPEGFTELVDQARERAEAEDEVA